MEEKRTDGLAAGQSRRSFFTPVTAGNHGADIPATAEAETILHQRGVLLVPDFIANAGGVICASVEHQGGVESTAREQVAEKIRHNTQAVLAHSRDNRVEPRRAAVELAQARVREAMSYRRQP
jgi:glutamate dehydrogenase/leucine dehydrogenase